jgi:uncharacterized membrane protein YeaQ/YmgE (transglycosylase-associated protein family)
MGLLAFILFGLVVGIIARALMPGRQHMGVLGTMLLGIAGAFVGGLIGSLISGFGIFDLHPAGLVGSVAGALVILLIVGIGGRHRVWT